METNMSSGQTDDTTLPLACVRCQQRKVKCDRQYPCSTCVKSEADCIPSKPSLVRKRKRPNEALRERLARCEDLIRQHALLSPVVGTLDSKSAFARNEKQGPNASSISERWFSGKMVQKEGDAQFIENKAWANIYEDIHEMRQLLEVDEPDIGDEAANKTPLHDCSEMLVSMDQFALDNIIRPAIEPSHIFKLWQVFVDRVNPLTKLIHVPSVQPLVAKAVSDMGNMSLEHQALLLSICSMAVVSLSKNDCSELLGISWESALHGFSIGSKMALKKLDILKTHSMVVVQALLVYPFLLEYSPDYDAAWTFSSVTVRIAQKMGLHRDGEQFGLSPFETEMRRRIWWQVVRHESRLALLSGRHPLLPRDWDTKPPQNINDADMFPDSTRPIIPREGPTEMAFVLLLNHVYKEYISHGGFSALAGMDSVWKWSMDASNGDSKSRDALENLERAESQVKELSESLIALERRYVNVTAGPVHSAALTIRPLMIGGLAQMCMPMAKQPEWGTEITGPKDLIFKFIVAGFEHLTGIHDQLAPFGFAWNMRLFSQLDMLVGMTCQMCERPTGLLVDQAWCTLGKMYERHPELLDMSQTRSTVLARCTLRAWKAREESLGRIGVALFKPSYIFQLQAMRCSWIIDLPEQQSLLCRSSFESWL